MGNRDSRIVALSIVAVLAGGTGWAKTDYNSGIWDLLRAGGLCFAENGDSKAWPAGTISVGGRKYAIWGYSWTETPRTRTGSTEHASYRILVFEKSGRRLSYLGDYPVLGVPFKIHGQSIKFDFVHSSWDGPHYPTDEIVFGESGPPRQVVLDGELIVFDPASHKDCTFK